VRRHSRLRASGRLGGTQFGQELSRGRPPPLILDHAALDQGPDPARQVVSIRLAGNHPAQQDFTGPAPERFPAGGRERQDRAQAEDVARRPGLTTLGLFR
jgi:hypothetical protein